MKKSRILAVAGVALLATGVLAACGSSKSSNAEAPKAYGYTYTADPETLDYLISGKQSTKVATSNGIDGLFTNDQYGNLTPAVVQDLDSGKVVITSQNHGFAVDADTLPTNARITHKSLFDNTLQGIELTDKPVFCFQGHPEASPGPQDVGYLFDKFIDNIKAAKQ